MTQKAYIEMRDEGYWVMGTRVSLGSIVCAFRAGDPPETIQQSFPVLSLEEVYGAITFYLANQEQIDRYLSSSEARFADEANALRRRFREESAELYERLTSAAVQDKPLEP